MSKDTPRKSPSQSATLYKTGTTKTGNDGNKWIIVEDKNGTKRWKLHKKTNSKSKTKSKAKSKPKAVKAKTKTKSKTSRKSPSHSATLYKVGTKKTGNDGNTWVIVENKSGTKRWALHKKLNSKSKTKSKSQSKSKTLKKVKKTKTKSKSKNKPKRKSKAGKYSIIDFYDVKQLSLSQLETVINANSKAKYIYNKIKSKLIPLFEKNGKNVGIVPVPLSSGGIYWSDYSWDYIEVKYNYDTSEGIVAITFYMDKDGKNLNLEKGIYISYSFMSKDEKKEVINELNKSFDGYYEWTGKNTEIIQIHYNKGKYKTANVKNVKDDDIYPRMIIYLNIKKYKTFDNAEEIYNTLEKALKKLFKNNSVSGSYSLFSIDFEINTVNPKTYKKNISEFKKLLNKDNRILKTRIDYYPDRSSNGEMF